MTPLEPALAALLVAGHAVGDFVLQTGRMVRRKDRLPVLAAHAAVVGTAHLLLLVPFLSLRVLATCGAVAALHGIVDGLKGIWTRDGAGSRGAAPLPVFLLDQALHLAVLAGAWWVLRDAVALHPAMAALLPGDPPRLLAQAGVLVAAFAFAGNGGSAVVSGILRGLDPRGGAGDGEGMAGSGRLIGILERLLALILVLVGQWGAMALLLAAKSIARFEELKERRFAEYYLVGTLASLLVAVATGMAVRALLSG